MGGPAFAFLGLEGLTTSERIQLVSVILVAIATLASLINLLVGRTNERRRTQPIVVANEQSGRRFARENESGAWAVEAFLTSEGSGTAFNVRFGVEFAGVRYAYRYDERDPPSGNLQRVLPPRTRMPESGAWPILIPSLSMHGRAADTLRNEQSGTLDAARVYWARYENAEGQTWETRNPGDRSTRLDIRRVRNPKRHEKRERETYDAAVERDDKWIKDALAELRQQANAKGRSKGDVPGGTDAGTQTPPG